MELEFLLVAVLSAGDPLWEVRPAFGSWDHGEDLHRWSVLEADKNQGGFKDSDQDREQVWTSGEDLPPACRCDHL